MKIEIKNRFTGKIIIEGEYENVKDCLIKNSGADLRGADLCGANLYGANLRGAKNIKLPILSLNGSKHSLYYINDIIQIGCEKHSVDEWIKNYESIGKNNDYTEEQITEYGNYIKMIYNMIRGTKWNT